MTTAAVKDKALVEIERLGFAYQEVGQYDLDQLSWERRVQVREVKHYAPKDTVDQFAIQMGETVFPPVVVTADGWIIDGNTRVGARLQRKEKFTPAVVLDIKYGSAPESKRDMLHALAATLNAQGGVRLTRQETRDVAVRLIRMDWKADQIARAIGMKASDVSAVRREVEATAKLGRVGLSAAGVPGTVLRALGGSKVADLNDLPFKEIAELALDAGFNASEVNSTAKAAKEAGSDQAALEVIANLRKESGDRIVKHKLDGKGKPPFSQIVRMRIAFLDRYIGKEDELVETDPNVSERHIEALKSAIAVLSEVLRLQEV